MTHVNEVELLLDKSFKSVEDKERFLVETLNLQVKYGETSSEYRDYLREVLKKESSHVYAGYFLYLSFIYSMEIENARQLAIQIINISDGDFSRGLLSDLDDSSYVMELVYRYGDREKLPPHVVKGKEEEDDNFMNWIDEVSN